MKKIILIAASLFLSVFAATAQDLGQATEVAKSANDALMLGDNESALNGFKEALELAEACGDEGANLVETCKGVIPRILLSMGKDQVKLKNFDAAIANRGSVKSATFDHGMDYGADLPYSPVTETLEFGSNNSLHYTETAWGTTTDHYVYKDASGDIYAYNVDADGRVLPDNVYEEDGDNVLKGVNVTNFGFYNPMGYGVYFYSFEEIAKLSAAAALANACGERGITMPTENSYDVGFNASYADEWENKVKNIKVCHNWFIFVF